MALQVGDQAPDLPLRTLDGQPVQLARAWRGGQPALLIFLRHLGWLPCREHVAQLCQHWDRFAALSARAVIITFGAQSLAHAWLRENDVRFELWLDPERVAYRAFGLERSLVRSWGPRTLLAYARLMLCGRHWRGIQGDSGQLGGDVVVDTGGIVRFAHRSRDPTDRPTVEAVLDVFRRLDS